MALSLQECIDKVKEKQPSLYPVWYIEDQGKYLFNLLKRGVAKDQAISNFYVVDPDSGSIAGPIPVMSILDNEDLAEKLQHPHMIAGQDQKRLVHAAAEDGFGWSIKKKLEDLEHHGIKGQKWGVRRFQNEDGTLTEEGRRRYGYTDTGTGDKPQKMTFREKWRERDAKASERVFNDLEKDISNLVDRSKSKETKKTNTVVMDVAFTMLNPANALFLAYDGGAAAVARHKLNSYMKNRDQKSDLDPNTGLRVKKEGAYTEKEDLAAVNPAYMDLNTNTKSNCMLCTTTYDLRKRGYDVTAQLDSEGYTFPDIKRWYPDSQLINCSRRDDNGKALSSKDYRAKTKDMLLKQGDGARGNFMISFFGGGGHSIVYEVKNGQVIFKDAQTNKVYKNPDSLLRESYANSFVRLDNVEPDMKRIKAECVR